MLSFLDEKVLLLKEQHSEITAHKERALQFLSAWQGNLQGETLASVECLSQQLWDRAYRTPYGEATWRQAALLSWPYLLFP